MRNINFKSAVIGFLLAGIVFTTLGSQQKSSHKITVQRIDLVDEDGNPCGALGAAKGTVFLRLGSPLAKDRLDMSVCQEETQGGRVKLNLASERGMMSLTSGEWNNAGPLIYMTNETGKMGISLGLWGDDGEGYLRIDGYDFEQRGVPAKKAGQKIEGASLMVVDPEGEVIWSVPAK